MNGFDYALLRFFSQFANRWWALDRLAAVVAHNDLLKGGVAMTVLWWVWSRPGAGQDERRVGTLVTLLGGVAAVACARALALLLPHRPRPLVLFGAASSAASWENWSSFPSDHASLFFALVAGLFTISRRLGWAMLAYVAVVICLPRIYLGLHYPTDMLAGAALGALFGAAANCELSRRRLGAPLHALALRRPAYFYPGLFLATFQIATLFADVRRLGALLLALLGLAGE